MNHRKKVENKLERDRYLILYYPQYANAFGSCEAAIVFQQLAYWSTRGDRKDEGIFHKTDQELAKETSLTETQVRRVRKDLLKIGVINTWRQRVYGVPKMHYSINWEMVLTLVSEVEEPSSSSITKTTPEKTPEAFLSSERKAFSSKDIRIEETVMYFLKRCLDEFEIEPFTGVKEKLAVRRALNSYGLEQKDLFQMIEDAMTNKPDPVAFSLSAILSKNEVNLYRLANRQELLKRSRTSPKTAVKL